AGSPAARPESAAAATRAPKVPGSFRSRPRPTARRCRAARRPSPGCPAAETPGSCLAPHPFVEPHELVVLGVSGKVRRHPRGERELAEYPTADGLVQLLLGRRQELLGRNAGPLVAHQQRRFDVAERILVATLAVLAERPVLEAGH